MRRADGSLLLAAALALAASGCGARPDLPIDSGPAGASTLPCGDAATGAQVWQVALPADQIFDGPFATDDAGTTYFLGLDALDDPTSYTLVALDSCGRTRWRSAPRPPGQLNSAVPDVVVAGDRVLFQWGTVDAFDRATGAHLWNVDLDAVVGDKLAFDDWTEIGPLAVAADGTAYLAMILHVGTPIVSIDPAGTPAIVAQAPGPGGDLVGFLLDADDHLDVLWNSVKGAIVTSTARDGSSVFESTFACQVGFLGPLAAGADLLVMQSGPCGMSLEGKNLFSPPSGDEAESVTLDAAGNLYVTGGSTVLSRDAHGAPRWEAPGDVLALSEALLATGGQIFTAEIPPGGPTPNPVSLVARDAATGAELARYPTGATLPENAAPPIAMRITAAGQVVLGFQGKVTAFAVGQTPDATAQWPTRAGGPDRRNAALGR